MRSPYCQAEFNEARRLQKRIVTVQIRDRTELTDELDDIQYVDMKAGVDDPDALTRLSGAVRLQLSRAAKKRPLWQPRTPRPALAKEAPRLANTPEVDTPPLHRPAPTSVRAKRCFRLPAPRTILIAAVITGLFASLAAYIMLGRNDNGQPTDDPQQMALDQARNFSGGNDDWEPILQAFDGVPMVLVPAGCFEMGSTRSDEEKPPHRVCFDEPFWIDRTEVTNGQFAAFNGQAAADSRWTGAQRPREQITWTEAAAFCESRGARLPTEAEWEYAAGGPDSWEYPWGDEFVSDNVVWSENAGGQTADVGSKPDGVSWVGTWDLSGNVWEWAADWYEGDYYRTLEDGAVNPTGPASGESRVFRGGSWPDNYSGGFRAAFRSGTPPDAWSDHVGFRCARSR